MRNRLIPLALALLPLPLSACAVLHSEEALIAASDPAPDLVPGLYQGLSRFTPEALEKLDSVQRARCLDLGFPDPREAGPVPVLYCPFDDEDLSENPKFRIAPGNAGFVLTGVPGEGDDPAEVAKEVYGLRLRDLGGGVRLVQVGTDKGELKGYFYALAALHPARIEAVLVPCDGGASKPAEGPRPKLKCEVESIDAIRGDVLAYAAKIADGEPVKPVIATRIGD
ncbi:hypothetical protein ACFQ1E_14675 [Sphingomonas canadensis]|uniref:DUF4893 domain-containing protein n=1 Tax=Sphingomonas canadensis TaxID=1219257 RepID=A0ABW3H7W3_9SPHN|nr:hypothetical protein [Sphingomonas canadensis]MCW3837171.1 hypothetical protein [Sphingomonas canadensis]